VLKSQLIAEPQTIMGHLGRPHTSTKKENEL